MAPPLNDVTNTLAPASAPARRVAKPGAKPVLLAPEPPAAAPGQPGDADRLVHSFRGLALAPLKSQDTAAAAQQEEEPASLAAEDSSASTGTASAGGASQLGSPIAAFAAAKARLQRSTSDAESRISSTLQALNSLRQGVAGAARWGA